MNRKNETEIQAFDVKPRGILTNRISPSSQGCAILIQRIVVVVMMNKIEVNFFWSVFTTQLLPPHHHFLANVWAKKKFVMNAQAKKKS